MMPIFPIFATSYENFELNAPLFTMEMVIWGIVIGVCVGAAWSVLTRRSLGTFVTRLHRMRADTPDAAVTLAALGMGNNPVLRLALREGKPLRKYAQCANETECLMTRPARIDLSHARFYMPDDLRYEAEVRYEKRGTDIAGLIIAVTLMIGLGFGALWLLPHLLSFLDNAISSLQ